MSFTDIIFYPFLLIVFFAVLIIESPFGRKTLKNKFQAAKKIILLTASYIFYGYWDYRFCFLLLFLSAAIFFCAKRIDKGKIYTLIGIVLPLVILGFFKYFNFFTDSFSSVFNIKNSMSLNIILPVGISFYTFQSLSYIIDVKRKTIPAETNFIDLALYIAFFPQLVAGPIVKASEFLPQLKENRTITKSSVEIGIQIFVFGLFKKVVLADNLAPFVDDAFSRTEIYSGFSLLMAVIAYSFQIYFDFSGYSDMAIGCAKMLGFDFSKNFNMPYISKNVSEFWKRWHISLSSWLQSYLYIPLGGNRKGTARTYINLLITMILGGLWHGANRTFIIWGLLHGTALCINKAFRKIFRHSKDYKGTTAGNIISVIITYIFVCFCWIFFRSENLSQAIEIIKAIVLMKNGINFPYIWLIVTIILSIITTIIIFKKDKNLNSVYPILNLKKIPGLICFITFVGIIIIFAYTGANPFVYFQF